MMISNDGKTIYAICASYHKVNIFDVSKKKEIRRYFNLKNFKKKIF